jgi:hypothetical protein
MTTLMMSARAQILLTIYSIYVFKYVRSKLISNRCQQLNKRRGKPSRRRRKKKLLEYLVNYFVGY